MILTAALSCFMQEGPLPCFRRNKRSRAAASDGSGPAVQVFRSGYAAIFAV